MDQVDPRGYGNDSSNGYDVKWKERIFKVFMSPNQKLLQGNYLEFLWQQIKSK